MLKIMIVERLWLIHRDSKMEWILDSSCSFHMNPNKDWFESLAPTSEGSVLLGKNKHCSVLGRGLVGVKMFDGIERILSDMRYIPEIKRNLISLAIKQEWPQL